MATRRKRNTITETFSLMDSIQKIINDSNEEINIAELSTFGEAQGSLSDFQEVADQSLSYQNKIIPLPDSPLPRQLDSDERSDIEVLQDQAIEHQEVPFLPLDKIRPNKIHARKILNSEELEILKDSIRANGVLQPIIVTPIKGERQSLDYEYEIVAGYRRFRACYEIGLNTIPAIVKTVEKGMGTILGIVENLVREDIHPLEETYAIINLIKELTGKKEDEVIMALTRLHREEKGEATHVAINTQDGQMIMKIFELMPIGLSTFVTNRLRLLNMTKEILDAIIANEIALSSALLIESSIPDYHLKVELLHEAINYNYSREKVKERIAQIRSEYYDKGSKQLKIEFLNATKKLVSKKLWKENDIHYMRKVEKLIQEIQALTELYEEKRKTSSKKKKQLKSTT